MKVLKLGGRRQVPAGTVFFHQRGVKSVVALGSEDADRIVSYLKQQGVTDKELLSKSFWAEKHCQPRKLVELYHRPARKGEKQYPGRIQYDWEALRQWCGGICPEGKICRGQPPQYAGPKNLPSSSNYQFCYCAD